LAGGADDDFTADVGKNGILTDVDVMANDGASFSLISLTKPQRGLDWSII
jgi:hypothetical protein